MDLILQVFYSVFSGLILSVAIPNEIYLLGNPYLTLIAIIPLYLAFNLSKNYRQAFICFAVQTITTHLGSSFWLAYFKNYAYFTLGASALGTGFIGGFLGLLAYLPFSTSKSHNRLNAYSFDYRFMDSAVFKAFYFAMIYTLYEWVKSNGFLGYPWGTVSSAVFKWPHLMQLAAITGTYGITFLIVLFNCIAAQFLIYFFDFRSRRLIRWELIQEILLFGALLLPSMIYGFREYNRERIPQKILTTILVQQNFDPWKQTDDEKTIIASEKLTVEQLDKLAEQNRKPDLVVWSEGCLRFPFPNSFDYYNYAPIGNALFPFLRNNNIRLLAGAPWIKNLENRILLNSAILFDEKGLIRGHYGKNHLVPFAEVIPFREYPAIRKVITSIVGISAGWTAGDQYTFFDIPCSWYGGRILPENNYVDLSLTYEQQQLEENRQPTVRISTPICFDDSFTDIMRPLFLGGSELFMNITDDSWSETKSSEYQHFVIASYRAIEYRTTLVRSTNSGYSVVLSPAGKILADQPLFIEHAIACDIPVYERIFTTYARFGNWLPATFVFLFFVYCYYMFRTFQFSDYIPSERKLKKKSKHKKNKNSKFKK